MKIACQENKAPGATFAERLRNLEKYGFEGVELNDGVMPDRMYMSCAHCVSNRAHAHKSAFTRRYPSGHQQVRRHRLRGEGA